jgi:hypothetical protein
MPHKRHLFSAMERDSELYGSTMPMQTLLDGIVHDTTIVPATKVDAVAETLIQSGLVPNAFILDLNRADRSP